VLAGLRTPHHVQAWLDATRYGTEPIYRSPRSVLRDRTAHCFDGALFAAAALERLGYPPLLIDLRAVRDDDHVLAVYRHRSAWGAVGKSNFVGLRGRDPVYRSVRELAMSYFDGYFNSDRERTLRSVSRPVRVAAFERLAWRTDDAAMDAIAARLDEAPHEALVTEAQARRLAPVDERTWAGHTVGTDFAGTWKPEKAR
jgi:hypothetical protein